MSNFLYLFRGGDEAYERMSQEERQEHMELWGAWMENLQQQGNLVDGQPLGPEGKVVRDRGTVVTDGPFVEGSEVVGGYLIVSAADFDEATEISKGCPIFDYDGAFVEIREIQDMDNH